MKLAELLARELKVWPEEAECATQENGGCAYFWKSPRLSYERGDWVHGSGCGLIDNSWSRGLSKLATDHATAIVTRADWEAEVARMASVKPEWIRHRGGKCPVEAGVLVDIRFRDSEVWEEISALEDDACQPENWRHDGVSADIMAYRICEPEQATEPERSQRETEHVSCRCIIQPKAELLYDPCARGPLQWRDRIREIDITVEALEEERAGLVQQLEDEGFRLIGKAVQPVGDMRDWRNWRDGDLVECISHEIEWSDKTDIGSICKIDGSPLFDENGLHIFVAGYFMNPADFRWHSRPSA